MNKSLVRNIEYSYASNAAGMERDDWRTRPITLEEGLR